MKKPKQQAQKRQVALFEGGEKAKKAERIKGAALTLEAERLLANFEVLAEAPGGVKKLREMILGLALHGRLVAQDPQDESASKLLQKIATARGPRKTAAAEEEDGAPQHSSSSNAGTLPESWQWTPTNSIADCILGKMLDGTKHTKGRARTYLRNINVRWASFDTTNLLTMFFEDDELERYGVKVGDVLVCEGGEPGRAAVWTDPSATMFIQKAIHRVRLHGRIVPQWFVMNLRYDTWTNRLSEHFTGATIKHFTGRALADYTIRLAPVTEQARIVAKVDELMALCDEMEARQAKRRVAAGRLNKAALGELTSAEGPEELAASLQRVVGNFEALADKPESIVKLRDAILDLAVQGKLVPTGGGHVSLNDAEVAEEVEGKYFPTISLPMHWNWGRLGAICRFIDYRGRTPNKTSTGIRLITAKNVRMGYLRECPIEYIADEDYENWMTRGIPKHGDLLFTTEAPLGNVAQLLTTERVALAQRIITLHPVTPLHSAYLKVALISPLLQHAIRSNATGTTAQGIKAAKLKLIQVPLPPLAEQARIVAKVDHLMALCETLEAKIRAADEGARRLAESLVAELIA